MFSPAILVSRAIVLMVIVAVHEFAHAYTAHLMGDDTAKEQGRMTLNPAANIYLPGFIIGVLVGFAILGSAPVNPYRMRNPRWGTFLAVLNGPLSNLLLAALCAIPFRIFPQLLMAETTTAGGLLPTMEYILYDMVQLNVVLFIFNLLPLAPLDGWKVVLAALPPGPAVWWQRNQQNSNHVLYALVLLAFLGPSLSAVNPAMGMLNVFNWLVNIPATVIMRGLLGQ